MKAIILSILFLLPVVLFAQKKQKRLKAVFCGVLLEKKVTIKSLYGYQYDFIRINENDTIVDVGAGSGWFEGAFSAVSDLKNIHFYLVDIDTACLSSRRVSRMVQHYSGVKGDSITNRFTIINNTVDSLWLPLETFPKLLLFNTLHEISDKAKMVRDIHSVLRKNGEVIVLELDPRHEGDLHGGCRMPLMEPEAVIRLFTSQGFAFHQEMKMERKKIWDVMLYRFIKQ